MRDRNSSGLKAKKQLSVVSFGEHQTRSSNSNSNASGDTTPSEVCEVLITHVNITVVSYQIKVMVQAVLLYFSSAPQSALGSTFKDITC